MLDMHRLNTQSQTDVWYSSDGAYTMDDLLEGWDNVITVREGEGVHLPWPCACDRKL